MSISTPILRTAFVQRSTAMSNALFIFGGAIFLAVLAQISIPVPGSPVPVTGQTFGVLLLATSYGASLALSTFGLYLLAGIAGAPDANIVIGKHRPEVEESRDLELTGTNRPRIS